MDYPRLDGAKLAGSCRSLSGSRSRRFTHLQGTFIVQYNKDRYESVQLLFDGLEIAIYVISGLKLSRS